MSTISGYLTVADLAKRLGVKAATIHRYLHKKDLPKPEMRIGQSPLWKEETIQAWEKERKSASWSRKK